MAAAAVEVPAGRTSTETHVASSLHLVTVSG